MKNVLKYILCFAVCVGAFFATATTVYAESDEPIMCGEAFNVGDRIYYYGRSVMAYKNGSGVIDDTYMLIDQSATANNIRVCLYLETCSTSLSGFTMKTYNNMISGNVYDYNTNSLKYSNYGLGNFVPTEYLVTPTGSTYFYEVSDFKTNIPIFENKADADVYYNTGEGLNKAINYKKVFENGSWVKPFEDIEINDSNMSSPQLANVSHSGFTCINIPDDRYMVDVYLESGIQQPYNYQQGLKDTGTGFFINSFGLISDQDGAYTGQIDLLECYGVDNVSALTQSCIDFYTNYPSVKAFNNANYPNGLGGLENNSKTFAIWGQPFARNFVLWTINSSVSSSEISAIDVYNIPIAYTNYKVRYFYYDDDTGFHYGPWTNFVYFSDGRVLQGTVFQGDDGSVIETPLDKGSQDSSGNVSINTAVGNIVDLNNPNELFGYIRASINNVNVTGNTFMSLFASVFSFLPADMLGALWLGIGCMILIGVAKALWG